MNGSIWWDESYFSQNSHSSTFIFQEKRNCSTLLILFLLIISFISFTPYKLWSSVIISNKIRNLKKSLQLHHFRSYIKSAIFYLCEKGLLFFIANRLRFTRQILFHFLTRQSSLCSSHRIQSYESVKPIRFHYLSIQVLRREFLPLSQ